MSDTVFSNGVTLTDADWFNDVNRLHYTIFSDPANRAAARDTLFTAGSVAVSTPIIAATQTWNDAGVTFVGNDINITSTASAAPSLVERWRVGGSEIMSLRKDGLLTVTGAVTLTGNLTAGDNVADAHTFTGTTAFTGTAGTGVIDVIGSGNDRLRISPQTAGSGTVILTTNNGITDYEPIDIRAESVTLSYRTGVLTSAAGITLDSSGNTTLAGNLGVGAASIAATRIGITLDHSTTDGIKMVDSNGSPYKPWIFGIGTGGADQFAFYEATTGITALKLASVTGNATLAGTLNTADGTLGAGTLAYFFSNDTNTGFYRSGADAIMLACGGVDAFSITTATGTVITAVSGAVASIAVSNSSNTAGSSSRNFLSVAGSSAGDPYVHFFIAGVNELTVGLDNSDSDKFVWSNGTTLGSSNLMEMTLAGAMRWNAYGAGTLTTDASGNITAVSDVSAKRNVRPFTRGIEALRGIAPILHGYTEESGLDQSRDDYAGFSAQNVQPHIPEAVGVMADGRLTLNDRPILAAAVNSINYHDDKIEQLLAWKEKASTALAQHGITIH